MVGASMYKALATKEALSASCCPCPSMLTAAKTDTRQHIPACEIAPIGTNLSFSRATLAVALSAVALSAVAPPTVSHDRIHQFIWRIAGAPQAAHNQRRGSICEIGSFGKARPCRESQNKGRGHGITSTIGIDNLTAVVKMMNREMQGRTVYFKQAHTLRSTCDQDTLCVTTIQQPLPRFVQFSLRSDRRAQCKFSLGLIRCERSSTLKTEERTMRVYHHHLMKLPRQRNTGLDNLRTDDPVLVIG